MPRPGRPHELRELMREIIAVVGELAGVDMARSLHPRLLARPARQVIVGVGDGSPEVILHIRHPALGVVTVGETVAGSPVIPDAGHPAEGIIEVLHGTNGIAERAEGHALHCPPDSVIRCRAEQVVAHQHAHLPAQAIIGEIVGHVVCSVAVSVVGNAGKEAPRSVVSVLAVHYGISE